MDTEMGTITRPMLRELIALVVAIAATGLWSGQVASAAPALAGRTVYGPVVSVPSADRISVHGAALGPVTAISAGHLHTCALLTDATVWCWGYDYSGQLGDGTRGDPTARHFYRMNPVQVRLGSGKLGAVRAISAGLGHTCALRTDRTVWCWGGDTFG